MERLNPRNADDMLNEALSFLQARGTIFCRSELRAPWAFSVAKREMPAFHAVTCGKGWLEIEGENRRILLSAGDLVVLPHGDGHVLRDSTATPPTKLERVLSETELEDGIRLRMGGRGACTVLICGGFQLQGRSTHPILANLPRVIHIRGKSGRSVQWLRTTLRQIDMETRSSRRGSQTVIARLADILFIQSIRAYFNALSGDGRGGGWIGALKDPQIGVAIALIHQQPELPWSVVSLASSVRMSRSSFSAKFSALVGEPPLKYVARWRVHKASALLLDSNAKLAEIAELVGYESEIAFNRAFKRLTGVTPGTYRREHELVGHES